MQKLQKKSNRQKKSSVKTTNLGNLNFGCFFVAICLFFCLVNRQKLGKCACMGGDYFALNLKMGIDGLGFLVYNSGIKF